MLFSTEEPCLADIVAQYFDDFLHENFELLLGDLAVAIGIKVVHYVLNILEGRGFSAHVSDQFGQYLRELRLFKVVAAVEIIVTVDRVDDRRQLARVILYFCFDFLLLFVGCRL
jgi:hypothetical protein